MFVLFGSTLTRKRGMVHLQLGATKSQSTFCLRNWARTEATGTVSGFVKSQSCLCGLGGQRHSAAAHAGYVDATVAVEPVVNSAPWIIEDACSAWGPVPCRGRLTVGYCGLLWQPRYVLGSGEVLPARFADAALGSMRPSEKAALCCIANPVGMSSVLVLFASTSKSSNIFRPDTSLHFVVATDAGHLPRWRWHAAGHIY